MRKCGGGESGWRCGERSSGVPAVVRDSINRRHDAGAMPPADAVNVHGLIGGVAHDPQKFRELSGGRHPVGRHRNLEILQPGPGRHRLLAGVGIVARQVDHGLDAERREIAVISIFRLASAVVRRTHFAKVVDPDVRGPDGRRTRVDGGRPTDRRNREQRRGQKRSLVSARGTNRKTQHVAPRQKERNG